VLKAELQPAGDTAPNQIAVNEKVIQANNERR